MQKAPSDFNWNIGIETIRSAFSISASSAPGPDGIPYAAWNKASDQLRGPLTQRIYNVINNDRNLPKNFDASKMTFIPKGETEGQSASISRQAQELRPLNLSNTDNKIIALILNEKLAELAQLIVSGQQRGFIKGRHIDDNILQLEAAAIVHSLTNIKRAAMVLFDFSAAFPSVSHRWIFKVLEHMQIPSNIIHAIRELYKNSTASICINNVAYFTIGIYSGIKQGCPLSGTIFALAIDPLIRYLLAASVLGSMQITAYADDLAIVIANLFT